MVTYKEAPHPAAFILSEAPGQLSRDNIKIAESMEFPPGTVLANGAGGYTPGTSGGALAIAIYGVKTAAGETVEIAALTRSAEVNRHTIAWPAGFTDAQINAASVELAKQMLIVRGAALPSPLQALAAAAPPPPSPPQ